MVALFENRFCSFKIKRRENIHPRPNTFALTAHISSADVSVRRSELSARNPTWGDGRQRTRIRLIWDPNPGAGRTVLIMVHQVDQPRRGVLPSEKVGREGEFESCSPESIKEHLLPRVEPPSQWRVQMNSPSLISLWTPRLRFIGIESVFASLMANLPTQQRGDNQRPDGGNTAALQATELHSSAGGNAKKHRYRRHSPVTSEWHDSTSLRVGLTPDPPTPDPSTPPPQTPTV